MIKLCYIYNWIIVADDKLEKSKLGARDVQEKEETTCQTERKRKLLLASTPSEKMLRQDKCEER